MRKRSVYIVGILSLLTLIQILTVKPQETISLPSNTYRDHYFKMGNFDCYIWEFTSSTEEILILALTHSQYEAFYNIYLSEFTAILNRESGYHESGQWRPPKSSTWHFLYINRGYSTTSLTIDDKVLRNYYFPWIALILGLPIGISLIAIALYFTLKRKRRIESALVKHTEPSIKTQVPINQSSEQSMGYKYCPKCGEKIVTGPFCKNCGFDMKNALNIK